MRMLLMAAVGLVWLVTSASAQPVTRFEDLSLRLNVGDEVSVEDRSGVVTSGRIGRFAPGELAITSESGAERVFSSTSVRRVQKRGDSLGNGMMWGALIGGVFGGVVFGRFSGEFRPDDMLQAAAMFGGIGLGLGLGFDAMNVGSTTVFSAPAGSARSDRGDGGRVALHATLRW